MITKSKANTKSRCNLSASVGTNYVVEVYTPTSGRAFQLSSLIFSTVESTEGIKLVDGLSATAVSAGTEKLVHFGNVNLTNITDGPVFYTAVGAVLLGNRAMPTYAVTVCGKEF
jgi:hypothetical protein